jgi:GNAT superfamily N-acetyltransferase
MTERNFIIEEVTDLDSAWPEIKALFLQLVEYHEPWFYRPLREDWEPRSRSYLTLGPDRLILIGRDASGVAVGCINASIRRDYGLFDELVGWIDDAFVREEHRGHGLGNLLLSHAEAWHRANGVCDVRLQALIGNDLGLEFWHRHGFAPLIETMRKTLAVSP